MIRNTQRLTQTKLSPHAFVRHAVTEESKFTRPIRTRSKGLNILHDPLWNKGMGFPIAERDRLGLRGLLPPIVKTQTQQLKRALAHIEAQPTAITKNLYLQDLHNRNETLFHQVLVENIEEMAPLVYTPTVGDVCLQFGNRYTRSRGMYFSSLDRGNFSSMVYNWPHNDVQIIVVTDGSRVLGLGDLGANGMGISIGKLALYCAAGGIAPHRVLPVVIDVGTNNQQLLDDPHYIGVRSNRLEGEEYEEVIEEFMRAVFQRWPEALLQFEDFETHKAVPMLEKYRKKYRVFNDDIQGTGCVTLSGLISCARQANTSITKLKVLCAGAGSAGLGVCTQLRDGMVMAGLSKEEATANFVICSDVGAYGTKDGTHNDPHYQASDPRSYITDQQKDWVNDAVSDGMSLLDSIEKFKPDVLLGLSTAPKLFNETIIRAMAKHKQHPIIIPMSNPTSRCECTPEEAYKWSDGRAVVATGSPFPPYHMPDGQIKIPSQCNNMYIFPGLGLGAQLAGVQRITDTMIYAAAIACADAMTPEEIAEGRTFPRLNRIRIVSHAVALAVVEQAYKEEQVTSISESDLKRSGSLSNYISRKMYYPVYVPLVSPTNY